MLQHIWGFLAANWMQIGVSALILDRALERVFPNAAVLGKLDMVLSQIGVKA